MASLLNKTISTTISILQNSLVNFNLSFPGFSQSDIYESDKWNIKPRKMSTTICVDPKYFDRVVDELNNLYTQDDRGLMYRCPDLGVTITCYPTTHTLSVQGSQHNDWVDTILQDIGLLIDHSQSSCDHDDNDSDDDEIILPPVSSSTPIKECPNVSTASMKVQTECSSTITEVQTNLTGDTESKLKREIQQLKDANKDLKTQLQEYRELRSTYAQLSKAFHEQSERNELLQAKISSMLCSSNDFDECKSPSPKCNKQETIQVPTTNIFSVLADEVDDTVPQEKAIPSAPCISLMTPEKERHSPPPSDKPTKHQSPPPVPSAPSISLMRPEPSPRPPKKPATKSKSDCQSSESTTKDHQQSHPPPPAIVIFSNSICNRIKEQRFYRNKTTKVISKSGASIADIQKLVMDYEFSEAEHVILQA